LGGAKLMGILQAEKVRGKEVFSFTYHKEWLQKGIALILGPDLGFLRGTSI
jgi:serine/threonine-protein kinase HipA